MNVGPMPYDAAFLSAGVSCTKVLRRWSPVAPYASAVTNICSEPAQKWMI